MDLHFANSNPRTKVHTIANYNEEGILWQEISKSCTVLSLDIIQYSIYACVSLICMKFLELFLAQ